MVPTHLTLMTDTLPEQAQELRRTTERLQALIDVNLQLSSERDPRRLLDGVCHAARELLGAKHALLAVQESGNEVADYWATSGMDASTDAGMGAPELHAAIVGEALRTREPRRMLNPGGNPLAVGFPASHPQVFSMLVAPILSMSHAYGWVGVSDKAGAEHFSKDDERLLAMLCGLLGRTYENDRLLVELQLSEERHRTIFENSALGIFAVNNAQRVVDANPALMRMLGHDSSTSPGADVELVADQMYVEPEDGKRFRELLAENQAVADFETRWWRKDGSSVRISLSARSVGDANGSDISYIGMVEDITERHRLRKLVDEREGGLRQAERMARLAHVITAADGAFESWSETLPPLAGLPAEQLPRSSRQWFEIVHPDDREIFRAAAIEAGARRHSSGFEYRLLHATGAYTHIRQTSEPIGDVDTRGRSRWFHTLQDITGQKRAEDRIKRLNRVHAVLSAINSTIVRAHDRQRLFDEACRIAVVEGDFRMAWIGEVDADTLEGKVVAWNGGDQHCIDQVEFGGRNDSHPGPESRAVTAMKAVVCNDISTDEALAPRRDALLERDHRSLAVFPLVVDGRTAAVLSLHAGEKGFFDEEEMRLLNGLASDVAFALKYIANEQKLDYLAYYDDLTGLPNSTLFRDRLAQFLGRAEQDGSPVALYLVDLDHFTHVNETLGRHTGDSLLTRIARRFTEALPKASSLARISADTFAVAVADLGNAARASLTLLESSIFASLEQGFVIDGHELRVTAKVGVALFPSDGASADALFNNAEAALKQVKASPEKFLFYAPEMNARMAEKITLEGQLFEALDAEQLVLHYQPKLDLSTGQVVGAEALLRWQHPSRGLLRPAEFLAVAEDSDAIFAIGEWVLRAACTQTAAWHDAGLPPVSVSVNLSVRQFWEVALQQRVANVLQDTGLRAQSLELELTEKIVMQDAARFVERLESLKALGVKLSLDDFGTGYSSLSYLKRFPLDSLKVDHSFIRDVTSNPDDAAIVRAVISLGHSLGLDVVAEGVETEAQVEWLRRERCEQIQGYFFSHPLPATEFEQLLRSRKGLSSRSASVSLEAKTLLVVDDEPGILASLVRLLRKDGYRIITAQNAREALDLLALNVVHVIVSDHRMPVMTGAEFFGKVKTMYPETVRILFSGYIEIEALTDAVNRGAVYRFLLKPWDDEALREAIREAFHHYWLTHKDADNVQPPVAASGTPPSAGEERSG